MFGASSKLLVEPDALLARASRSARHVSSTKGDEMARASGHVSRLSPASQMATTRRSKKQQTSFKRPASEEHDAALTSVIHSKDTFPLKWSERMALRLFPLTALVSWGLAIWSWYIQYHFLSQLQLDGGYSAAFVAARRAYIFWDILSSSGELVKKMVDAFAIARGIFRERRFLVGSEVPRVDIAVVCCGESIEIILDTVRAAIHTDYPRDCLRIVVSDDRGQDIVRMGVEKLQQEYPETEMYYTAREKKPQDSHKAGNLNHVAAFLDRLPTGGERAPYLAGLDADMIPHPRWLRAQLPHLIDDPRLALTCPPPMFYNTPQDDPLSQSLHAFHRFEEILKDMAGVAWCTGSGWIIRREALEEIGGFPTKSLTEDLLCGMLMLGRGWRTAYIPESLQWGLVPESYYAHVRQITRWCTGGLQAGFLLNGYIPNHATEHLNTMQRTYGLWYFLRAVFCTTSVVEVFQTLIIVGSQWPHVVFSSEWQLRYLLRLSACRYITNFIHQGLIAYINGYAASRMHTYTLYVMNTYFAIDHWRTFLLPTWLGGRPEAFSAKFPSTGSLPDTLHERHASRRAPLGLRLESILWEQGAIWLTLISGMYIAAIAYTLWKSQTCENATPFQYLLVRILWPTAGWQVFAAVFARPLFYTLFPPDMPDREDLLVRDANGVAYPKLASINPKSRIRGLGVELVDTLCFAWAVVALVSCVDW